MNTLYSLFGTAIAFFYSLVPNYGFAITALTLAVMIIVTPLTLKGTRSMMMMQQLQPEMKKLQSKYKDDRQQLNEELLKFYKENNINPVGGCLPLLIQMPVFFLLYAVLRGLTQRVPSLGINTGWVTAQHGLNVALTKPPVINNNFVPMYLPTDSKLYADLTATNTMNFFGMDLAQSCSQALGQGILHALPYVLLIVIVGITGFVQQKQIQGRQPANAQVNQQQQMIMKIMPFFLPIISFGLPAGLVLYFAVSNLYRVGQQWFISRSIYGSGSAATANAGKDTTPAKAAVGSGKTASKAPAKTPAKAGASKTPTKTDASESSPRGGKPAGRTSTSKEADAAPASNGKGRGAGSTSRSDSGTAKGARSGATTTSSRTSKDADRTPSRVTPPKGKPGTGRTASSGTSNAKTESSAPPAAPKLQPRAGKKKR
jgi:YidC/Oxa1 family membrane protein insertase